MKCLMREFTILTTMSHPPFGADFHSNPSKKVYKSFAGAHNPEMTVSSRVASVHNLRFSQKWHINVDVVIEGGSIPVAVVAIRRRGDGNRFCGRVGRCHHPPVIGDLWWRGWRRPRFQSACAMISSMKRVIEGGLGQPSRV